MLIISAYSVSIIMLITINIYNHNNNVVVVPMLTGEEEECNLTEVDISQFGQAGRTSYHSVPNSYALHYIFIAVHYKNIAILLSVFQSFIDIVFLLFQFYCFYLFFYPYLFNDNDNRHRAKIE